MKSKQEAIEWIKRVPAKEGEIEIREMFEMSDFPVDPAEKPEGWRDQEQRFRDNAEASSAAAPQPPRQPGTTRFLTLLKADKNTEAGVMPSEKLLTAMGGLMEEMAKSGAMLSGEGLKPSSHGRGSSSPETSVR